MLELCMSCVCMYVCVSAVMSLGMYQVYTIVSVAHSVVDAVQLLQLVSVMYMSCVCMYVCVSAVMSLGM